MAGIKLTEKTQNVTQEYEPVTVAENVTVEFRKDVVAGKRRFFGTAKQGNTEVGHATWSDESKHLILTVGKVDALGDEKTLEVANTLYSGILQMLNVQE